MSDNIDRFNECATFILGFLYEHFPVKKELEISDFPRWDTAENRNTFISTVSFLEQEGLIRYDHTVYGGYLGVTLTFRGLGILNSTPESINPSKTLGSKAVDAFKNGTQEVIKAVVREIIKAVVAGTAIP